MNPSRVLFSVSVWLSRGKLNALELIIIQGISGACLLDPPLSEGRSRVLILTVNNLLPIAQFLVWRGLGSRLKACGRGPWLG